MLENTGSLRPRSRGKIIIEQCEQGRNIAALERIIKARTISVGTILVSFRCAEWGGTLPAAPYGSGFYCSKRA